MLRDTVQTSQRTKQDSNGIFLFYDSSRSKFLSVTRPIICFGSNHSNISNDRWLSLISNIPSNTSSYKIVRNGTITSISVQSKNNSNCTFRIRKNNIPLDLTTLELNNQNSKVIDNLNIDVNINDYIQCYMSVISGNIDYPVLVLELAWR